MGKSPSSSQERLSQILAAAEKPVVVLAHQDDEFGCTGLLQRLSDRVTVVFMTNGDGLAPSVGQDPAAYAALRKKEALSSLRIAGISSEAVRFLGHSEIEIYRHLAFLRQNPTRLTEVVGFFKPIYESIASILREVRTDAVFTVAFQGGHPEHDLVHFFTATALRVDAGKTGGAMPPFYHFPEYELTILIPMRFRPWYRGEKLWIHLTEEELERKRAMVDCYPSQKDLIRTFERVVSMLTLPKRLLLRSDPLQTFFAKEQLSPVHLSSFDYQRPPYRIDFFNYMFEDFQGIPITFRQCIRPLVAAFERTETVQ